MTTAGTIDVVDRVTRISLTNFRGFKGSHTLDTDADLVLISGPNGCGKSSLLTALVMLLTGWHGDARPVADLIARLPAQKDQTEGPPMEDCKISADVVSKDGTRGTVRLGWSNSHDDTKPAPMPSGLAPSRLYVGTADDRELDARICAFFQDRVPLLFDQAANGRTWRDVFEPIPPAVVLVENRITQLAEDFETELSNPRYREAWGGIDPKKLDRTLDEVWQRAAGWFHDLRWQMPDWPAEPAIPEHVADDAELDRFARALTEALGTPAGERRYEGLRADFRRAISRTVDQQIARARRKADTATEETVRIKEKLAEIDRQLNEITARFPNLDRDLTHFAACDQSHPDALAIF